MVFLYIFLSIILFFIILLILPMNLIVNYNEFFQITVKILFFKFKIIPDPVSDNENLTKKETKNSSLFSSITKFIKSKGPLNFLKFIYDILKLSLSSIRKILKRTKIKELTLNTQISSEDAAETALNYSKICIVIYNILGIITKINKPQKLKIDINLNFLEKENSFKFKIHVQARVFYILFALSVFIYNYLKIKP